MARDSATRWVLSAVVLNFAIAVVSVAVLTRMGASPAGAMKATAVGAAAVLSGGSVGADSWTAMAIAYEDYRADPSKGPYRAFRERGVKFQYPPSSLLLFDIMPASLAATRPDTSGMGLERQASARLKAVAGAASMLATFLLILVSVLIFEIALRRVESGGRGRMPMRILLSIVLGCTFYPVVQGHHLGQIQVFLNLLVAVALLGFLVGRPFLTGAALGLCSVIKPQFVVILLWAVLRRRWSLVAGFTCVLATGLGLALIRFGWQAHVDYLQVLQVIGRHGEVYWPNQSVNGLVNRLVLNGSAVAWDPTGYAPFSRVVYLTTLVSSAALMMTALWPFGPAEGKRHDYNLLDLLVIVLTATLATPVAWEHHFGILLPVLAIAVPILMRTRPFGSWTGPLLLAAVAASANVVPRPELLLTNRWHGLAVSHLFLGAVVILSAMLLARRHLCATPLPANLVELPNTFGGMNRRGG